MKDVNIEMPIQMCTSKWDATICLKPLNKLVIVQLFKNIVLVLYRPSWVTVYGTKYKVGAIVHSGFFHLLPWFSITKKIAVVNCDLDRLFFILESLNTIEFNEHYHSFKIRKPSVSNLSIFTQKEFTSYLPMHIAKPVGSTGLYVSPKYDIDLFNFN